MNVLLALAIAQALATPAEPYRAVGTRIAWSLTIGDGRLVFEAPGARAISVAAPRPRAENGTTTVETPRLSVMIMQGACDGANGRRYADAVFVTVGRREYSGCGGAQLPADSLDGTSWHLVEIAGSPIALTGDLLRDDIYAVDFGADGFVGYGGCNRFSARYSRAGDTMTVIPPLMSTRGACREPAMSREQKLFQILSAPVRISFPDADTLLLTGNGGAVRLRRTRADYPD